MRELLLDLYGAALRAADPVAAVRRALAERPLPSRLPVHLVAIGKAAHGMAQAAVVHCHAAGLPLAGGVVVGPDGGPPINRSLRILTGDHPVPGAGSAAAAVAVAEAVAAMPAGRQAVVLVSGGASSLVAPRSRASRAEDLHALWTFVLASGLDIKAMNALRKRCLRWGAGRLAAALAPRPVTVLCMSDVIGDDPGTVGSGPAAPDPLWARDVFPMLESAFGQQDIPSSVRRLLERQASGAVPDTPKPGDAAFDRVTTHVIASNRLAVLGVVARARELGLSALAGASDLAGEASDAGVRIGAFLRAGWRRRQLLRLGRRDDRRAGRRAAGRGGRCQELALAAAAELDDVPGVALLAAGTDGRDGPTDAAGALVDGTTWGRIAEQGRDPEADLKRHDAYDALEAAAALLRTGPTGTNVMDVVIGLRQRGGSGPASG